MGKSQFADEAVAGWRRLLPQEDTDALGTIQRLIWSGRIAESLLQDLAKASGLRHRGDYEVLALIRRAEPNLHTPVEISQALMISPSGVTGKLDRLEQQGLIERIPDSVDRRVTLISLTDSGRGVIEEAFRRSLSFYQQLLEPFEDYEKRKLDAYLAGVLTRLEELQSELSTEQYFEPSDSSADTRT